MLNNKAVLRFDVLRGQRRRTQEVPGGPALLGSAAHCDVQLPTEVSAPQQMRVELRDGRLYAQTLDPSFPCILNGAAFAAGFIDSGAEFQFGHTLLRIALGNAIAQSGPRRRDDSWPLPIRIAGFGTIIVGAFMLLNEEPKSDLLRQSVAAPALFSAEVRGSCPVQATEEVQFTANQRLREAIMRRERAPFFPRDGVIAAELYREAQACFEQLGETAAAEQARRDGQQLEQSMADEFHIRHVRLERLLSLAKYAAAQRELQVLKEFVRGQDGAYNRWLSAVERELRIRFSSERAQTEDSHNPDHGVHA